MIRTILPSLIVISLSALVHAEPPASNRIDYSREILPILANNCFTCHGPAEQKAGLRLDQREHAIKPTRSKATAIRPGKADESELMHRILADDAERMPPLKSKKTLTAAEKELLRKWIDQGASYQAHWAFVPPTPRGLPIVKDKAWIQNEIDAFIRARLEHAGLPPSPRADKTTLIRRLSLDLRGIPPSVAEIDQFLADAAADAYPRLVDRMLASPRYGEKMALLWLDLARFGDTSGFENDSSRQMWMWRDWVIAAFNKNLPFDQFTIEQLAGDLLPGASTEQKIASGFNRNSRYNEENGADPEEFVIRYNVDRTNTLGQVWLGMTLGCAECHSHKYDPISQKEYYQLFAYFTGIKEPHVTGLHNAPLPPILKFPSPEQAKSVAGLEKDQAGVQKQIDAELAKIVYTDPLERDAAETLTSPQDAPWFGGQLPGDAKLEGQWQWSDWDGKHAMVRAGAGLHQHLFTAAANPRYINAGDSLFTYVYLDPHDPPKSIMLQFNDGTWEHRAYWGDDKCLLAGTPNGPQHFQAGALPPVGKWVRLEIDADKLGLLPDTRVYGLGFIQFDGVAHYAEPGIRSLFSPEDGFLTSLRRWEPRAQANSRLPADLKAALKIEPAKRSAEQMKKIRDHYLRKVYGPVREVFDPLERDLGKIGKKLKEAEDAIPYTMVSEEMQEPRPAYVLLRGEFDKKGEKVERAVPAVFPPLPGDAPNTRLGLARWLVRPDHPLTARVAVNRLWAQLFGTGIVKTIGDFGTQGEMPSHPELLDWLALDFVSSGWDVKTLLKKIALSNTYQQSSVIVPGAASKMDPNNRLLSRAPRFRLSAEEIRDSALAISGLLSAKIGGPSVMPYQPPDFYKGKNEGWPWAASKGDEQYRRGMYTFWRRTTLHPMFAIFDAPSREECSVARSRTNTPLQALVTLNDPTFVEAARVFAQKVLRDGPSDRDGRLTFAFRSALARAPSEAELRLLGVAFAANLQRYRSNKDAASQLVQVGTYPQEPALDLAEHAAWTSICNILLNLDETLTRE